MLQTDIPIPPHLPIEEKVSRYLQRIHRSSAVIGEDLLSPEQEMSLIHFLHKLERISLSTQTDRSQAEASICWAYRCSGLPEPQKFIWLEDPIEGTVASEWLTRQKFGARRKALNALQPESNPLDAIWGTPHIQTMMDCLYPLAGYRYSATYLRIGSRPGMTFPEVKSYFESKLSSRTMEHIWGRIRKNVIHQGAPLITGRSFGNSRPASPFGSTPVIPSPILGGVPDFELKAIGFLIEVLARPEADVFKGLWSTVEHCGWWWPFNKVVVLIPKPRLISFDANGKLHQPNGDPALEYSPRFRIHAWHGIHLPPPYAGVPFADWKAEWILTEPNAQLRSMLIEEIGYARLIEDLKITPIDRWREYELQVIQLDPQGEPVHLLKMVCPSTGHTHVLRAPPVTSAREAMRWCNWDIDPEDFVLEA